MNMRSFTTKRSTGFTLVETLVAVAIITLAVSGPLFMASRAVVATQIARDQLTASYLAQEGIEYVRAMRDAEFLAAFQAGAAGISTTAWNNFLSNPVSSDSATISGCKASTCTLDPSPDVQMGTGVGLSLQPCTTTCTPLYLVNGFYTQQSDVNGAVATPFTRTVQAFDAAANDERIVSKVTWNFHGTPYTVTVTDHLSPWQ